MSSNDSTQSDSVIWNMTCPRIFNQGFSTRTYHNTEGFVTISHALGIINIVASPPTVALSIAILATIIKTKPLQTRTNMILLSLLLVNLSVGLFSLPANGICLIQISMRISNCFTRLITSLLGSSFVVLSILLTMLLSYDRYVAISRTYQYEEIVTKKKILCAIIAFCITSFVLVITTQIAAIRAYSVMTASVIIFAGYVYNVAVHVKLFFTVRRMRMNQITVQVGNQSIAEQAEQARRQKRTFKFTAYVIAFFLLFNLPSTIAYGAFKGIDAQNAAVFFVVDTILCLHATFSPLLYLWQSPGTLKAMRLVCCGEKKQDGQSVEDAVRRIAIT